MAYFEQDHQYYKIENSDPLLDPRYQEARSKEIKQICQGVRELNDIAIDMNSIVFDQNKFFDQIGTNIEETASNVEQGEEEVVKAYEDDDCCSRWRKRVLIILTIISIILCILLILKFLIFRR
jgi:t-SNARE complex subunit (syntaxin)